MRLFLPPASVVTSGSALTWLSGDGVGHTATDLETFCFHTSFGTSKSGVVRFTVADGALSAQADANAPEPCDVAPQPDGSFLLSYLCLLHPEMTGSILVR